MEATEKEACCCRCCLQYTFLRYFVLPYPLLSGVAVHASPALLLPYSYPPSPPSCPPAPFRPLPRLPPSPRSLPRGIPPQSPEDTAGRRTSATPGWACGTTSTGRQGRACSSWPRTRTASGGTSGTPSPRACASSCSRARPGPAGAVRGAVRCAWARKGLARMEQGGHRYCGSVVFSSHVVTRVDGRSRRSKRLKRVSS